jgi:hypothetical protein
MDAKEFEIEFNQALRKASEAIEEAKAKWENPENR